MNTKILRHPFIFAIIRTETTSFITFLLPIRTITPLAYKWLKTKFSAFQMMFVKCSQLMLHFRMFGNIYHNQIFNSVVGFNPIYMMNLLFGSKFSSKFLLNKIPMFKIPFSLYLNQNISIFSKNPSPLPVWMMFSIISLYHLFMNGVLLGSATPRAVFNTLFNSVVSNRKSFTAVFTSDFYHTNCSHCTQ